MVERKERQSSDRERKKIKVGMKAGFAERNRETYIQRERSKGTMVKKEKTERKEDKRKGVRMVNGEWKEE
jgi:hypothetical protein